MKLGVTKAFPCSYLPEQNETLLMVVDDEQQLSAHSYQHLLSHGFRRSGQQVYRPHCAQCQACESLRIPVSQFKPSKSQKRVLKRNAHFQVKYSREANEQYFPLYARYIEQRHADGSMYPPNQLQFEEFIHCQWLPGIFIEVYDQNTLVAVAVTDEVGNALSALYTFYDPDIESNSPGTLSILLQLQLAAQMNKSYVYLGYQIDACDKMNYKRNFYAHERFFDDKWHLLTKKCD